MRGERRDESAKKDPRYACAFASEARLCGEVLTPGTVVDLKQSEREP